MTQTVKTIAIIGTGVIGAGWAARALAHGLAVVAWDPSPTAETAMRAAIAHAWPVLEKTGLATGASQARLTFAASVEAAVAQADFIQENAPEREELKRGLLAQIDAAAPAHAIIASSTSGLLPTSLQSLCTHPERVVVGHPFNPVYLLPLVEIVGGAKTSADTIERTKAFYQSISMRPLHVKREIEGFVADRLMEALWREALWLVNDGIATTEEIDAAVVYGCGLRWSLMGTFLTFHLAGGDAGMRHMLHQFGPALKLPWTKLVAPELTEDLIEKVVEGCEHQAAGRSVKALEKRRDDFLIDLLALTKKYWPEAEVTTSPKLSEAQKGLAYAVAAHTLWAAMIVYLKLLSNVPAVEAAVHRGLWAFPIAAFTLWWTGAGAEAWAVLRNPKKLAVLAFSAFLIAFNWALYIWAIGHDRVVESALGYYVNPLMNVLMGVWFLGERLSRLKAIALVIAAIGVVAQAVVVGVFPWVGLVLASTFCLYGFLRKQMAVSAVAGFFVETLVLLVPTTLYVVTGLVRGDGAFLQNMPDTFLLLGLGPFTALPLLFYSAAVRRICR
eukprot:gene6304-6376_t